MAEIAETIDIDPASLLPGAQVSLQALAAGCRCRFGRGSEICGAGRRVAWPPLFLSTLKGGSAKRHLAAVFLSLLKGG